MLGSLYRDTKLLLSVAVDWIIGRASSPFRLLEMNSIIRFQLSLNFQGAIIFSLGPHFHLVENVYVQVAVNALLGETSQLVDYGTALMANLATKEVKAVVCISFSSLSLFLELSFN